MRLTTFVLALALLPAYAQNLLSPATFDAELTGWAALGSENAFRAANGILEFATDAKGSNIHLDQNVKVHPETLCIASVEIRSEGRGMAPGLRIAGMDWSTLAEASAPADGTWHTVVARFYSGKQEEVRFQLFGAGRGRKGDQAQGRTAFRNPVLRMGTEADMAEYLSATIGVDTEVKGESINPLFFGVNSLFWITDDAARADGKIAAHLKDMGCTLIRFPGGEVADNYHWQTNRLDDTKAFPYEEGAEQMDFDEFMAWLGTIGAAPICVVNLESGFLHGDVESGVKEAAEWVRYANVTKKYGVKYWEIGNETDLLGTRYSMTAEQYANAVVRFSQAMKAVDPTIQIGALGPMSPLHAAPLDRVSAEARAELQALPAGQRRARGKEVEYAKEGTPWWPTVCRIAEGHFDFAIVHRYDNSRTTFPDVLVPPLNLEPPVRELDAYLRERIGREVPLALTEWNVWRNATELGKPGHALTIAEQIGNYLSGGIDMANYWPMRYPRGKAGNEYFRGLLSYETKEPRAAFHVMKLFREYASGQVVGVETGNEALYAFATHDAQGTSLFVINRLGIGAGIEASLSLPGAAKCHAHVLVGDDSEDGVGVSPLPVRQQGAAWTVLLPPRSLAVFRADKGAVR